MKRLLRLTIAAPLGLALMAAAPIRLESNRAIYAISLASARPGGLVAVWGRTAIEFRVTCKGYATTQRFLADMTDSQGQTSRTDFALTSFEASDGRSMRFDLTNMSDGQIAERYKGTAELSGDGGGTVTYSKPEGKSFALPQDAMLPTAQTIAVLKAAEEGKRSVSGPVFQGGGSDDLYQASATIGRLVPKSARNPALADNKAWSVLMSYYPMMGAAETPAYEIAAPLYEDGVIGSMEMIYPRFTLKAELQSVRKLKTPHCLPNSP